MVKEGRTSAIVELFRYVRNNLQFLLNKEDDKVILVTSSISGEGKSFISMNIASSFALLASAWRLWAWTSAHPNWLRCSTSTRCLA